MGLSLPCLSRAVVGDIGKAARDIGLLYGADVVGASLGAFAGTWYLVGTFGIDGTIAIAALLALYFALELETVRLLFANWPAKGAAVAEHAFFFLLLPLVIVAPSPDARLFNSDLQPRDEFFLNNPDLRF